MKKFKIIIFLISIVLTNSIIGQNTSSNIVDYRVVAHQFIDNSIHSVSNEVSVAKKLHIQVPNAFSPDGDGVNDHFTAVSDGVEVFTMRVYNRWGEQVYYTEDISKPWQGKYKGTDCQQGAYVYVIKAKGIENQTLTTLKGTVSLIR